MLTAPFWGAVLVNGNYEACFFIWRDRETGALSRSFYGRVGLFSCEARAEFHLSFRARKFPNRDDIETGDCPSHPNRDASKSACAVQLHRRVVDPPSTQRTRNIHQLVELVAQIDFAFSIPHVVLRFKYAKLLLLTLKIQL